MIEICGAWTPPAASLFSHIRVPAGWLRTVGRWLFHSPLAGLLLIPILLPPFLTPPRSELCSKKGRKGEEKPYLTWTFPELGRYLKLYLSQDHLPPSLRTSTTVSVVGHFISASCSPVVSSLASGSMVVRVPARVTLDRLPLMAHMQGRTRVTISQKIFENTANFQCTDLLAPVSEQLASPLLPFAFTDTPDLERHSVCRGHLSNSPVFLV